jgi:hypothetical protein
MTMLNPPRSNKIGLYKGEGDFFLQKNGKFPTTKSEISYNYII